MADRVRVLEGDLGEVPALPHDLDAVVHCAGDVSFDPPVDEGFRTNVLGTRGLLERVGEVGPHVHYVHISTAYVAGRRRGAIPEGPVDHTVDVDAETEWGMSQRRVVEHVSRSADVLDPAPRQGRAQARAGRPADRGGRGRVRPPRLGEPRARAGRHRARALARLDRLLHVHQGARRAGGRGARAAPRRPRSSAPASSSPPLRRPHPGWIEGFKMAEPLILAYGRGELPEFPAAGDTIVDIVPVDHVVAAIVAVLASPPEPGAAAYFHVVSGARNPLTFRQPVRHRPRLLRRASLHQRRPWVRPAAGVALPRRAERRAAADHQRARPQGRRLRRRARPAQRPHAVPRPQPRPAGPPAGVPAPLPRPLPGVRRGRAALRRRAHPRPPRRPPPRRPRDLRLRHRRRRLGPLPPRGALPGGDRADPRARRGAARPRPVGHGDASSVKQAEQRIAAFFDMDGTLLSSNVIETYLWMRLQELSPPSARRARPDRGPPARPGPRRAT